MNTQQTIPATPLSKPSASIDSKVFDEPQSVEPQESTAKTVSTPNEAQKIKLGNDANFLLTIATGSKQDKKNELSKEIEGLALDSKMEEDTESNSSDSTVDLTGAPKDANMTTIDFDNGFIFDHLAKKEEMEVPHKTFLWKGRKVEVGQITETFVRVNDQPCRLTGVVTKVGPLPSEEWQMGTSDVCCAPRCLDNLNEHKEEYREKVFKELGTLNGQTFESYSYVNIKFETKDPVPSPMKQQRIYKVTYVANENKKYCVWQVSKIQDVTELYFGNAAGNLPLPQEFEAFRQHWSDKCGYYCPCGHTNMGASSFTLEKGTDLAGQMTDVDGRVALLTISTGEDEEILLCKEISVADSAGNTEDLAVELEFAPKEIIDRIIEARNSEESNVNVPTTDTSSLHAIGSSIEDSNTIGDMNVIEVKDGWIEDDWAKLAKELNPNNNILFTGQRAEVGQGTDTNVIMCNGKPFRFTGVVIEVGPLPSMEEWQKERGYQNEIDEHIEGYRKYVLNELGTLHGQTVVSLAYLNVNLGEHGEIRRDPLYLLPFKENRIYKVTHTASEDHMNAWVMSKIEDVNDLYLGDGSGNLPLPQVFKEFRENWYKPCGCGCNRRLDN